MRRMLSVSFAAAALLAVVSSAPAGAIVAGVIDGNAHPYVGALLGPSGKPFCSGVLVATVNPDSQTPGKVLLTSAHCIAQVGAGKPIRVAFGANSASGPIFTGTSYVMPGYVPRTFANDVAVVVFKRPPAISPAHLEDGDTLPGRGVAVTTVGFGTPNLGIRKSATEIVTGSNASWLDLRIGSGNSCNADSGGPDLILPDRDDSAGPVVVALTDQGSCSVDQDFRVNTPAVVSFVNDPDYVRDTD